MVRHEGKRVRAGGIEARAIASPRAFARAGFIVPLYRHGAVQRNRLKRRLRELVRLELLPLLATLPPMDVVLRALPHAYARDFDALQGDVRGVARQLAALAPAFAAAFAEASAAALASAAAPALTLPTPSDP